MTFALTVLQQVIIMFLLIFVGYLTFKIKMIDRDGVRQLTDILLYIVMPAMIFSAFMQEKTAELLKNLFIAFALAIASYIVGFIVAYIFIRDKNNPHATVERFAVIYPNNGFMGIPLIAAVLGQEGVFYAAAFICIGNVFTWTHGVTTMSKSRTIDGDKTKMKLPIAQLLLSPALIAFFAGLVVFLISIPIPSVLFQTVGFLSGLNTPIAMLVVGATLAQTDILSAFKELKIYKLVFLINILVPVIVIAFSIFIPVSDTLLINNIILTACPSAAITIIFAEKYKNNVEHATKVFTLSSLLTIVTLPLMMLLTEAVL